MGKTLAKKIKGMSLRTKICIVLMLLVGSFIYQGVIKPLIGDTATNTYYFTTDTTAVNLGGDGSTSTAATLGGRISMKTGVYATSRSVTAASNTSEQRMISAYSPAYGPKQTVTAPAITIGVRDRNGTTNPIWWKAYVYKYNPAVAPGTIGATGTASNATILWTSNQMESHPSVQTPLEMTFTNPQPQDVEAGWRIKVVITARLTNTASSARLYWGSSTNYSFFKVTEAVYVANSLTVTNLSDYYGGALANVTQGDTNVPMLQFDLYSNVSGGASWTGGKLDKIGTNTTKWLNIDELGDVSFSIYKDSDGDGVFESTDTKIGGPYNFGYDPATSGALAGYNGTQPYTLTTAQTITTTPQRYFITYSVRNNATSNTTVGARIIPDGTNSYFTVTGAVGGVINVTSTSSSTPTIQYGGTPVIKNYPADWDAGTPVTTETGSGITTTDSTCIVRTTAGSGFPLVGLLNYPAHSCTSVAGQNYSNTSGSIQPDFIRLYFGGSGYHSNMLSVNGRSLAYRVYTPVGGGTVTLQLFYVTSGGVRVNAPITSKYTTTTNTSQSITTSLAGQNFSNVPLGARLGIQIGITTGMQIGLGKAVNAQLQVEETAAENENVDVGNGFPTANAIVYAGDTVYNPINGSSLNGKQIVINSFTLTSSKPLATPKIVNAITIKGSALFNSTNVKEVRIYSDSVSTGTLGLVDASDTLIGSTTTITGTSAVVPVGSLQAYTTVKRYLVVVDIGYTPNTNIILTALVDGLAVATIGGIGENIDATSSTLTLLPTTILEDAATEPANVILPSGAGATKLDAFRIKINGGINDTISNVKITLSTDTVSTAMPVKALGPPITYKLISDYVSRVDILTAAGVSLGHLTSPTMGNDWQIATIGLAATTTPTDYFVAITPKPGQSMTYDVKAKVISIVHSRTTNKLVLTDNLSATIIMDQLPPGDPSPPQDKSTLTAVTGTYGLDADLAKINLSWTPSTDASGSAVTYRLVRGLGNAPPPRNCNADGVKTKSVPGYVSGTSFTDKGLDEGVSYGYRVCAVDSVNNVSDGSAKSTTASIKDRCTSAQIPELSISPSTSYVKAGNSVSLDVGISSTETGSCTPTTYTLSFVPAGSDAADSNFNAATFEGNNFTIAPNRGSQYTHLIVSAKPGAIQNAEKIFSVKIVTSKGAVYVYPDPIHVKVNKFGTMMHSSMQLGTARYGQWGMDYDCATCHHPDTSNIKQVKDVITTPTGDRPVLFSIISTAANANVAGVFGNDMQTRTASTNVCEVCHHRARFHQYSASKVAWKTHNNNGDCMSCHSHKIGFKTLATGLTCDDCHGNPPTTKEQLVSPPTNVLFPYATNAGSHDKHNQRGLKCATCHSNANHLLTPQPDKNIDMGFKVNGANFPGFHGQFSSGKMRSLIPGNGYTYVGAPGMTIEQAPSTIMNCNVYCHGWENNGGYNTEPAWTGITQVGCGSCHAASNEVPPESGSHHKHADNEPGFGNGIACAKCHGFRNYSTSSVHIDGDVEWDLSTITPTARYRGLNSGSTGFPAPTAPGNYGTCQNLYCHSNVVSSVNNNGTGAPNIFNTPTWGGTTNCNSCHQAQPNLTGGHPQHAGTGAGDAAFDCRICHGNGGDANPLKHGDSYINFEFRGLGEGTHYYYSSAKVPGSASYGTCYNGNCHGSRRPKDKLQPTALTWGAQSSTPLCDKCHTTNPSAGGFYGTMGPNGTTSKTDPYVGAHFQHITSMPFKLADKYDCSECHYKPEGPYTPGHMDTALPAELTFGTLASSGVMNGYTSASHQPGYNFGSRQCSNIWCHGSGMNSVENTGLYGAALDDGAPNNTSRVAAPVWNSPFLAGTVADCKKCHDSPPPAPLPGYNHWDDDNNRAFQSNQCITCHKHVNAAGSGFTKPAIHANGVVDSCLNCHGLPPVDDNSLTKPAINALGEGMVGAHQAHFLNPTIGKRCNICHYNYSGDMPSYKLEIGFNAYGGKVSRGTFYGYSTIGSQYEPAKASNYSQPIVYFSTRSSTTVRRTNNKDNPNLKTCQNLYCHGGGINAATALQGGSNVKPGWEAGASQAECGSCHGVTAATYTNKSHGAHVSNSYGKPNIGCVNCHGIKVNNYHVDGQVEWEFYGTTAQGLNMTANSPSYTPTGGTASIKGKTNGLAPSTSFGTCTVYCHSDGRGTYANPRWGDLPMNCGSCHKNQTTASSYTGIHQKHTASFPSGYGIDCLVCHSGSGSGSALHVNGNIDVVFNTTIAGNGVWESNTCKNISCHVSSGSDGPKWDTGTAAAELLAHPATCTGCHAGMLGVRDAIVPQFAYQSHHVQRADGTLKSTDCSMCHWEGTDDGGKNVAYHAGSLSSSGNAINLVVWPNNSNGVLQPSNRPTKSATTFVSYTANGKRSSMAKLNNVCLGCHNSSNASFKPFNTYSTIRYSWEARSGMAKTSILSRYSSTTLVKWSIYSTNSQGNAIARFGTNKKSQNAKALSAHGNASKNQMFGWNATDGEDAELAEYTYAGTGKNRNVFCYDCHNSHGSNAGAAVATGAPTDSITSSYSSATGRNKGGLLKTTTAGIGGYANSYVPVARTVTYKNYSGMGTTIGTYNAGASICNDCHNEMNPRGETLTKPWSVQKTYSSTGNRYKSIGGYWSTPYFDNYTAPSALRSVYKQGGAVNGIKDYRKPMGGHFGSSINGIPAAHSGKINGLCTPCHDPHGVTRSLGANRQYAVPLLKGTWMTSPYKEDKADIIVKRGGGSKVNSFNGGAIPGYHIDQNTLLNMPAPISGGVVGGAAASLKGDQNGMAFRNMSNSAKKVQTGTSTYTTKLTVAQFGGLCTSCHTQTSLTGSASAPSAASAWKSKERIHQTVNGWAATTTGTANTANKIHAYTCSKCHAPHVSRLPRLMVTNCLDVNHLGKVASGGTISLTPGTADAAGGTSPVVGNNSVIVTTARGAGRFPGGGYKYWDNGSTNVTSNQRNAGPWWFQSNAPISGGTLTQPAAAFNSGPYNTNCHNSPTAGGTYTWGPALQRWNNKTEW